MSRVVLTSSRQLTLGGSAATVMGPLRASAPSGVSQTDWDDNTVLQMIFDGIESSAELQQELQDLEGVKLLNGDGRPSRCSFPAQVGCMMGGCRPFWVADHHSRRS